MAQSNASQTYTCALTGISPLTDPVVTPSGYICSRKILLTKLGENGGVDPFDGSGKRSLDEGQLVDLATRTSGGGGEAAPIPPRPPKATSLPSLLTLLRDEFDAVLLELYDTRKALEETRKELSSALYQNDAAVRVVARVVQERDDARGRLEEFLRQEAEDVAERGAKSAAVQKRGREGDREGETTVEASAVEAPPKKAKTAEDTTGNSMEKIPSSELDAMISTWKSLSKLRKVQSKQNKKTPEETTSYESTLESWSEVKKANLHKASAKAGVLCLSNVVVANKTDDNEYVVSGGHDKQAIVYNVSSGTIVATLSGPTADITAVSGRVVEENAMVVATGSADGMVRLYSVAIGGEEDPALVGSVSIDNSPIVYSIIHPSSSTKDHVRIIAATQDGALALLTSSNDSLEMVFLLKHPDDAKYASGALHPDGLIYAAGTTDGKLLVWDLRTQSLAGSLECHDGNQVNCIAFSENGYHVATSSSAPSTSVLIWDLRKLKSIATINPNGGEDDTNLGRVTSVAFDPSGLCLAYSGEEATKICVVKDVDRVICTLVPSKSGRKSAKKKDDEVVNGGVVWGGAGGEGGKVWLASGCDVERPLRIWGAE